MATPAMYFKKSEQKPPTCEDKASDSCDDDDKEEEEEETELILELRLEVKAGTGVQSLFLSIATPLGAGLRGLVGQKWVNGLNYVKFNF